MKSNLLLILFLVTFSFAAVAEEIKKEENKDETVTKEENSNLRANFRKISLDVVSTEVKNADRYQNSSVSALNSDSETRVKGVFDFILEYEKQDWRWDNSLYMIYGKRRTKPVDGPRETSKNDDQILAATDLARRIWNYNEAKIGPFVRGEYETQFTVNDGAEKRRSIARGKSGIKLFSGKYFSNLYAAGVFEHDMSYEHDVDKLAWEIGATALFPLRDGVNFTFDGYYRDFFSYSEYNSEDLKYDLSVEARMNVKLVDDLNIALAPFVNYRLAESRGAGRAGSNLTIGLSLSYSNIYNIW